MRMPKLTLARVQEIYTIEYLKESFLKKDDYNKNYISKCIKRFKGFDQCVLVDFMISFCADEILKFSSSCRINVYADEEQGYKYIKSVFGTWNNNTFQTFGLFGGEIQFTDRKCIVDIEKYNYIPISKSLEEVEKEINLTKFIIESSVNLMNDLLQEEENV